MLQKCTRAKVALLSRISLSSALSSAAETPGAPRLSLQEAGMPGEIAVLNTSSEGPPARTLESFLSAAWPETLQRAPRPVRRGKGMSLLS